MATRRPRSAAATQPLTVPPAAQPETPPAAKPAAPQVAKPAAPQVAKPAAPQAAKPAAPQAAKATPPQATTAAKAAKAVNTAKPAKPAKSAKPAKADKPPKLRRKPVRDSFTMPEADFALIATLKARALAAQRETKKSELLRAGLHALAALDTRALVAALGALDPVKIGRPRKGR